MKKIVLMVGMLWISTIVVNAQAKPTSSTQTEAKPITQDSIIFQKTTHDYGTIVQGGDGNCEFKFTNKGKEPLVLTNVRSSCGCTVPQWPKEPIAPGKTGVIKVKYDTNRLGAINKTITVSSNSANSPVLLRIKGNVKAK